ncbi:ATP-binding protein [Streptomyces sp. YIM S03343]
MKISQTWDADIRPLPSAPEDRKSLTLAADDRAPGAARSFTRGVLTLWGLEDVVDDAVLIVSELTTNAVRHGQTCEAAEEDCSTSQAESREGITLTLTVQTDVVAIEVQDNSPQEPVQQAPEHFTTSGRGLSLVSSIAESWTTCPTEDGTGKRVSAFLKRP